jgi:hypothetical protein
VPSGYVANALERQTLTSGVKHVRTAATSNAPRVRKSEIGNGFLVNEFTSTVQALAALVTARLWMALGHTLWVKDWDAVNRQTKGKFTCQIEALSANILSRPHVMGARVNQYHGYQAFF